MSLVEFVDGVQKKKTLSRKDRWQLFCQRNKMKGLLPDSLSITTFEDYNKLHMKYFSLSIITCPKCKSNSVEYVSKQIRRADESETFFCTCRECTHKWSFS